jgi:DSBA-like thioredoxin domain-containing protein
LLGRVSRQRNRKACYAPDNTIPTLLRDAADYADPETTVSELFSNFELHPKTERYQVFQALSNSIGRASSAPVFLTLPTFVSTGQIFSYLSGHGRSSASNSASLAGYKRISEPRIKEQLKINTDEAIAVGVFGVPTFIAGGNLFWGDDATNMFLNYLRDTSLFEDSEMFELHPVRLTPA